MDKIMDALLIPGGFDGVLYVYRGAAVGNGVRAAYERAQGRGRVIPLGVVEMPEVLT